MAVEPVAQHEADEVHGEETGAADLGGEAVGEAGEPGAEHGEQADASQVDPDGEPGTDEAHDHPDGDAEPDLPQPEDHPPARRGVTGPGLEDPHGQQHGDRVVEAGLGLEQRPQPLGHRSAPSTVITAAASVEATTAPSSQAVVPTRRRSGARRRPRSWR